MAGNLKYQAMNSDLILVNQKVRNGPSQFTQITEHWHLDHGRPRWKLPHTVCSHLWKVNNMSAD